MIYRSLLVGVFVFWMSFIYGFVSIPENIQDRYGNENEPSTCTGDVFGEFITTDKNGNRINSYCLPKLESQNDRQLLIIRQLRLCDDRNGIMTEVMTTTLGVDRAFCIVEPKKDNESSPEEGDIIATSTPQKPCDFYTGTGRFRDCVHLENCEYDLETVNLIEIKKTDKCSKPSKQCSALINCESEKGFPLITQISCEAKRDTRGNGFDYCPSAKDCFLDDSLAFSSENSSGSLYRKMEMREWIGVEERRPNIRLFDERESRGTR